MSQVTAPILLDSTGQDISAKLQAIADAINGGTIDPLTVTQNGTYTPSGTTLGYGPVTVDVQGIGGGVPNISKVGYFGDPGGALTNSLEITIAGFSGYYALITIMHRDTITVPQGFTLLDETTFDMQTISIYKYLVASSSDTLTIQQANAVRMNASVWCVGQDFAITRISRHQASYYVDVLDLTVSNELSLVTFNAYYSSTQSDRYQTDSDGVWLNIPLLSPTQIRQYTGIVYAATGGRTVNFAQKRVIGNSAIPITNGEFVLYSITLL